MRYTAPARSARLATAAAALALVAVLVVLAGALKWHWWKPSSTIDIAGLPEAPRGKPLRLEANLTYHDPQRGVAVIQDDTGAIAFSVPEGAAVRAGQRIQLSGTLPSQYDPSVPLPLSLENPELTILQDQVPLAARKITVSELRNGFEPLRFEIVGVVKSAGEDDGRMVLDVAGDGISLPVDVVMTDLTELSKLIDAKVALRGVRFVRAAPEFTWMLLVSGLHDITVIEPPPAHPALVDSLHALIAEPTWTTSGHRIRTRGRVLKVLSANALLLTDGMVAIPVESTVPLNAISGTTVEVEGWPVNSQHAVLLQGARIVSTGIALPPTRYPEPLTSSDQIHRLSKAEAAKGLPVHVTGIVTGVNDTLGVLFMQDKHGPIYVRAANQPLPLMLGQRVTVRGVTSSDVAPVVTNVIIEPGPLDALPAPAPVTAEDLNNGTLDGLWVELEGRIRGVGSPVPGLRSFKLVTTMGPSVEVGVSGLPPDLDLSSLIDAKVRVSGVLGSVVNADGQVVGRRMAALPLRHFRVLTPPPPNPFIVNPTPIGELLRYANRSNGNRTRVSGTVTLQRGGSIYIQDETGGARVTASNVLVRPGEVIDVVGYATPGLYSPTLTEAEIRKTAFFTKPQAATITPQEALSGKYEYRLVQMEARVLSLIAGTRQQHLLLQNGGHSFEAVVFQRTPLSLTEGSIVKLTGVLNVQAVNNTGLALVPTAFRILVPDASRIQIIRAAPWWNTRNATVLFGTMACGTLLVLAWVWSLRRRVQVQTHEIEQQRQFLRQVIDSAPNFIFVKDAHGRFTLANRAMAQLYRTTPEEMIGKTAEQVAGTATDAICGSQDDQHVLSTQREKYVAEASHVDASGRHRWVQITKRPILDANEVAIGVLGVANDITQRKRDEQRLIQARIAAEAANTAKSDFLANMSHEIRTPLNGVIGMLDLLDRDTFDPEQRSMLETARSSADTLLTLINDVLDFSKIEAGKLALEQIDFELVPIIEDVATLFSRQAHAKGVEVTCFVHRDVPVVVRGDPTRLRQILTNLVSNAVKFTERGEVFIGLTVVCIDEGQGSGTSALLRVEVRDTGIGMSSDVISRLFHAFTQADSSTTRRYGGTGLGLTIAKRLIEAMNGTLEVTSEPGKGSTFVVTLPLPVTERRKHTEAPAALRGLKALIVDDNATNRFILEHYLETFGLQYKSTANASEALEIARSAAKSGTPFAIALLGHPIAEMNAHELISQLRAEPTTVNIPCIVLSSFDGRGSLLDTDGATTWLVKPVHQASLLRTLTTIVGRSTAPEPITRKPTGAQLTFPGIKVLLAEDNVVNQKVALRVLNTFGVNAELAVNGQEALERVKTGHFDLVLMDCQMPAMDGYEATRAIREWERTTGNRRIPIIAMTANALAGDRARCLDAGMDDHIPKPFKRKELGVMLAKWLRLHADAAVNG